ncbi:SDR family oxidoreductase [Niveibacterium umoris]|uniref:NAD(P)-dependent dehydrogenase (Short-subunit alcohol dehydrogenase family) n=1 Tax=Niveibacterium umoris TaxID=1193620 RepID=A0A840BL52_9RHOO|nr:NAD(P)-dependent dehydrogenase (short-subunit alcohol dehydrogenase family) [Niveibacterium umoris]
MIPQDLPPRASPTALRTLVVGLERDDTPAGHFIQTLVKQGGRFGLTYLDEKVRAFTAGLARGIGAEFMLPLDFGRFGELESVVSQVERRWGGVDRLVFCAAERRALVPGGLEKECCETGRALDLMLDVALTLIPPGGVVIVVEGRGVGVCSAEKQEALRKRLGHVGVRLEVLRAPLRGASGEAPKLAEGGEGSEPDAAGAPMSQA